MKSICLFNHKGGVSKTTTTFNLGWKLADEGKKVLLVDADSQCNLTGIVLGYNNVLDDKFEDFYNNKNNMTLQDIVEYLIAGNSAESFAIHNDKAKLYQTNNPNLLLLPGHIDISELDSQITVGLKVSGAIPATRHIVDGLPKIINELARNNNIDYILYDLSPNIGGLNTILLMSSDYFIVPTSPDFFCLQAVYSLSRKINDWYNEIEAFKKSIKAEYPKFAIKNKPIFLGIIQQKFRPRVDKPAKSYQFWIDEIRKAINNNFVPSLNEIECVIDPKMFTDVLSGSGLEKYDLAHIPDFNSLIAISQEKSKPIFALTEEDINKQGTVLSNMVESRDKFLKIFSDLASRIIKLTK